MVNPRFGLRPWPRLRRLGLGLGLGLVMSGLVNIPGLTTLSYIPVTILNRFITQPTKITCNRIVIVLIGVRCHKNLTRSLTIIAAEVFDLFTLTRSG